MLLVGSCPFDIRISGSMKLNCVQLMELIIQTPNAKKNGLLCPLMNAIKVSGESDFTNDPL